MKKLRIGNDILINWKIKNNEESALTIPTRTARMQN